MVPAARGDPAIAGHAGHTAQARYVRCRDVKVLVTGVTGFVGHHLVRELTGRGADVHGLVLDAATEPVPADVTAHEGNVCDYDAVRAAVDAVRPDRIVHLAGASSVGRSFADPVGTWAVNLTGTLTVLEAVRAASWPVRLLTVTSGEAYGRVPLDALPVTEDTLLTPLSPYASSKAAADLAAGQYQESYDLDIMRVRAFNHIGPGQDGRFVIPSVARQLAEAEREPDDGPFELHLGNVDSRRDFTDVRDVVRAYALLLERGLPGAPYLVGTGRSVSIRELVDGLVGLCRREARIVTDAALLRSGEQPDLYGSPERLRRDTGWTPQIPLETTLSDTLDWWRAKLDAER